MPTIENFTISGTPAMGEARKFRPSTSATIRTISRMIHAVAATLANTVTPEKTRAKALVDCLDMAGLTRLAMARWQGGSAGRGRMPRPR